MKACLISSRPRLSPPCRVLQPLVAEMRRRNHRPELLFEVALGIDVLGEDQQPAVVPAGFLRGWLNGADFGQAGTHVGADPVDKVADTRIGQAARLLRDAGHLVQQGFFPGRQSGARAARGGGSGGFDLRFLLGAYFLFRQFGAVVVGAGSFAKQA